MFAIDTVEAIRFRPAAATSQGDPLGVVLGVLPLAGHKLYSPVRTAKSHAEVQTGEIRAPSATVVRRHLAAQPLSEVVRLANPLESDVRSGTVPQSAIGIDDEHLLTRRILDLEERRQVDPGLARTGTRIHATALGAAQVVAPAVVLPVMPSDRPILEVSQRCLADPSFQILLAAVLVHTEIPARPTRYIPLRRARSLNSMALSGISRLFSRSLKVTIWFSVASADNRDNALACCPQRLHRVRLDDPHQPPDSVRRDIAQRARMRI